MAKVMSFAADFYTGGFETYESIDISETPTSVIQALISMPFADWKELCDAMGLNPETADAWEVLADLESEELMSCDDYQSPITVYLPGDIDVTIYE